MQTCNIDDAIDIACRILLYGSLLANHKLRGVILNFNYLADFLSGTDFESGLRIKVEDANEYNRLELLKQATLGKSLLHVGCADHAPVVERKMADGEWLHGILTEAAADCLGIDINQAAIDELKSRYGVENIINWNISTEPVPAEVGSRHWDYVILGEVLEHIDNPVNFLSALREKACSLSNYKKRGKTLSYLCKKTQSSNKMTM